MVSEIRRSDMAVMMALLMAFAQPACRSSHERLQAQANRLPPETPRLVGIVTLVDESGGFVLIDGGSLPPPGVESKLKTFTDGAESGLVKVGAVRRRPFVIADIVSGAPRKGDQVFQQSAGNP